ncbi:hypothetical protein S40288_01820 [Stachybotrys chartarum IBT 40288]|nr:hypothetical protein S40288_01820 [Stachybotrys chartarum IBT 40288]
MSPTAQSVGYLSAQCLDAFDEYLKEPSSRQYEWAENRRTDFSLWMDTVGAKAKDKGSLDVRLEPRPSELQATKLILQRLTAYLKELLLAKDDLLITQAKRNVDGAIEVLVDIGHQIRKAGRRNRYHKADSKPGSPELLEFKRFLEHRIHLQQTLQTGMLNDGFSEKHRAESPTERAPNWWVDEIKKPHTELQIRLIDGNLKRRNRFMYNQAHARKLAFKTQTSRVPVQKPMMARQERADPAKKMVVIGKSSPPVENEERKATGSVVPASVPATSSATTASRVDSHADLVIPPVNNIPPKPSRSQITTCTREREYPRLVRKEDAKSWGNNPSDPSKPRVIMCPCCCQGIPFNEVKTDDLCKKHLAGDLFPYTCIAEACPTPNILYRTREEWEDHVQERHLRRKWICYLCNNAIDLYYPTVFDLTQHVRYSHEGLLGEGQYDAIKYWPSLPMYGLTKCPLCQSEGPLDDADLINHILKHTHEFALLSLPWAEEPAKRSEKKYKDIFDLACLNPVPNSVDESLGPPVYELSEQTAQRLAERPDSETHFSPTEDNLKMIAQRWDSLQVWFEDLVLSKIPQASDIWVQAEETLFKLREPTLGDDDRVFNNYFSENRYFVSEDDASFADDSGIDTAPRGDEAPEARMTGQYNNEPLISHLLRPTETTHFHVPWPRNPEFTGRVEVLSRYWVSMSQWGPTGRWSLIQPSKSQIALEFAFQFNTTFPSLTIFWLHASSADELHHSFVQTAKIFGIEGSEDPHVDVWLLFRTWLKTETHGWWLAILDDATISDIKSYQDEYLPQCPHGIVLVTSRQKPSDQDRFCVFEIEKMPEDEAEDLIRTVLEPRGSHPHNHRGLRNFKSIAAHLAYNPLTMAIASCLMRKYNMSVTYVIEQSIALKEKSKGLLGEPSGAYVDEILLIALRTIELRDSLAFEVLCIMSYYNGSTISWDLLGEYGLRYRRLYGDSSLTRAVNTLMSLSLSAERNDGAISVHSFVQAYTRDWLAEGGNDFFMKEALLSMAMVFPVPDQTTDYEGRCRSNMFHVLSLLHLDIETEKVNAPAKTWLLEVVAVYHARARLWSEARGFMLLAIDASKQVNVWQKPRISAIFFGLSIIFYNLDHGHDETGVQTRHATDRAKQLRATGREMSAFTSLGRDTNGGSLSSLTTLDDVLKALELDEGPASQNCLAYPANSESDWVWEELQQTYYRYKVDLNGDLLLELREGSADESEEELHAELEMHGDPFEADAPAKSPGKPFPKVKKSVQSYRSMPPTSDFEPGTVLMVRWSDNFLHRSRSHDAREGQRSRRSTDFMSSDTTAEAGKRFHNQPFVVLANDVDYCTCLYLNTYDGDGCRGSDLVPAEHGIAYQPGTEPSLLEDEPELGVSPVRIIIRQPGLTLGSTCRINYSKIEAVSHYLVETVIGLVDEEDVDVVMDAYRKCWMRKTRRPKWFG